MRTPFGDGPIEASDDPAGEIGKDIVWIASGNECFRKPRNDDLEYDRKDYPVLEDFPDAGEAVVPAQSNDVLGVKDHWDEQWQAQHVVEVSMGKPASDVVRFEDVAIDRIKNQRSHTDGIGQIPKRPR